jgi:ferredoxin
MGRAVTSGMANRNDRAPGNAPGAYYIDSSCIDCDQCRSMAPDLFARNPDTGLGFVQKQPLTDDEISLAEEALAACATQSIGNDGI